MRRIYIYNKSHLPVEGWFQACFNCYQITSRIEKKFKYLEQYHTFICPSCRNRLKNKELSALDLNIKIDNHIKLKKFSNPISQLSKPSIK